LRAVQRESRWGRSNPGSKAGSPASFYDQLRGLIAGKRRNVKRRATALLYAICFHRNVSFFSLRFPLQPILLEANSHIGVVLSIPDTFLKLWDWRPPRG